MDHKNSERQRDLTGYKYVAKEDPQIDAFVQQVEVAAADKPVKEERVTWSKKADFLLSVIGFAVDLGNVWRFPTTCYSNGGGAFLIPYTVCFLFGGLPLFFMELSLGQYHRTGCITLWNKLCPALKGVGFAIIFINLYMSFYYNTIIATAFYYLYSSFTLELPWTTCGNSWNTEDCVTPYYVGVLPNGSKSSASEFFLNNVVERDSGSTFIHIAGLKWQLTLCLLVVFVLVYFSLWKGVKSSGKVVWVTAIAPYVILLCLLVRGLTLPGAFTGVRYYLTPNLAILKDYRVWQAAAQQIFFSLGPGFGVLLAFSSYNPFHNNCYRDAIVTSLINCLTSFLAGFVVFSVLGYLAEVQFTSVEEVAIKAGQGLIFEVYPEALAKMPGSTIWAIIFFFMLITLGLDSTFGGLESIVTALSDQFPNTLGKHREKFLVGLLCICFLGAVPTTTYSGELWSIFYDTFGTSNPMITVVFVETLGVCYGYGFRRLGRDIHEMLGFTPGFYWQACWAVVGPLFLFFMAFLTWWQTPKLHEMDERFPTWTNYLGYGICCTSVLWIPGYIIYSFFASSGSISERLHSMFTSPLPKKSDLNSIQCNQ